MKLPKPINDLRIVFYPNEVLRKKCAPVKEFDDDLAALARRMEQLLHDAGGVGLAAPQVGVPIRFFITNPSGDPGDTVVWVNPVLSDFDGVEESEEGCLSIPGVTVEKRRAARAIITGFDITGAPRRAEAAGLLARIWQHETDHLNGVLVIDAMSEVAELANRRAIQQLETDYARTHHRRRPGGKRPAKS